MVQSYSRNLVIDGNNPNLRAYGFYLHLGWIPINIEADGPFKSEMKFIKRVETPTITA
jgi:hypothetical protein